MDLKLIAGLYDQPSRAGAAKKIAASLGCDNLIIFIEDPRIKMLLPGPGFPQTLANGIAWNSFLSLCKTGYHQGVIEQASGIVQVTGFPGEVGSVAVLIGGTPLREQIEPLQILLPLITALLIQEQEILSNQSLALVAKRSAEKAERLATTLDAMRQQLRIALSKQEDDKEAIQSLMNKKDEFLNVASHELKTPLTSLKAYIQLLEKIRAKTPQQMHLYLKAYTR